MYLEVLQATVIAANTIGLIWLIKSINKKPKVPQGAIILDSCALIDGRILEVVQAGLIYETIIIPKFILAELQLLADGRESHKRARARFGLEVANKLRTIYNDKLLIDDTLKSAQKTDEQLIILAKKLSARLCTTDYNLNKVASTEGVNVLNMNELAQAVRSILLPGEEQDVNILQKGEGNQGVGYLNDGTMVVIGGARKYIGTNQTVVIERSLQTLAGKMCFAKLKK